jgi:hypothetical protein
MEEVRFCQKEPPGQSVKTGRWSHHHSWAPDHLPAAQRANEIREGIKRSQGENIELKVIPLLQGLHTQRESTADRPQGFPEDMSLPHRPPVLEVNG